MTDREQFVYLLLRHPEAWPQVREILTGKGPDKEANKFGQGYGA